MGWLSGTELMVEVIKAIQPHIRESKARQKVYESIIEAFEDLDWDCQSECEGIDAAFDKALYSLHPEYTEDDTYTFCITGTLSRPRNKLIEEILSAGFSYNSTITKNVTHLVVADPDVEFSKTVKARYLGIKCITEQALREFLEDAK